LNVRPKLQDPPVRRALLGQQPVANHGETSGSDIIFACPALPFTWLDTESGGQFVFMLRREDL